MAGKKDKEKKGIVENLLGEIPVLGSLIKELAKTEIFQKRFKEVNEKIEENLRKGKNGKWNFEGNVSIRPIINEIKKDASELVIKEDYIYGKKQNELVLMLKVPKKEVDVAIEGKTLTISCKGFEKKITLPDYFNNIKKKSYKTGILVVELSK